ncbi:Rpn family recombination-promoting nuclease/putative transposase [Paenibacillus sp. SM 69]|nr:Rpn family recombination-promoting nuclease/putative transposase [Paenibacillus oleatilyticus]
MEVIAMNEPTLQKAMDTLEFLSQNEEARRLYEMRQKALHDEASMIDGAKEEGKREGKREKEIEVAKNLLEMGLDVTKIAKATGLPESEVKKLKEQLH